jgi:hypothetical protein
VKARNAKYYQAHHAVFAAREASSDERSGQGREESKLSAADATAIFKAFREVCFVTGAKAPLTFMRIDPQKELSLRNAVPVKNAVKRLSGGELHVDLRPRALRIASGL